MHVGFAGVHHARSVSYYQAEEIQQENDDIKMRTWLLLDNQSNADIFCNANYLTDIRKSKEELHLHTNAGVLRCTMEGHLKHYGYVWYNPEAITNIVSLSNVINKYHYKVSFHSWTDNTFHVFQEGKPSVRFVQNAYGLYAKDMEAAPTTGVALLTTVEQNKMKFTKREQA